MSGIAQRWLIRVQQRRLMFPLPMLEEPARVEMTNGEIVIQASSALLNLAESTSATDPASNASWWRAFCEAADRVRVPARWTKANGSVLSEISDQTCPETSAKTDTIKEGDMEADVEHLGGLWNHIVDLLRFDIDEGPPADTFLVLSFHEGAKS